MAPTPALFVALALMVPPCSGSGFAQVAAKVAPAEAGQPDFEKLRSAWVADLEGKRLDAALSRYTASATFINPDGTHAEGAAAIRSLFAFVFTGFNAKLELTSRATGSSGDLAFDSGSYTETITEVFNNTVHPLAGDYLTVYRREPDSQWRIVEQAWTVAKQR